MADKKPAEETPADASGGGGIKSMLPLILTVILMPVMAFVMTQFVLLPKIQKAIVASASTTDDAEHDGETEGEHGEASSGHGEDGADAKPKKGSRVTYELPKLIVNVRGTMGTRFLMASFTLIGKGAEFTPLCEENDAQLRDVAMGVLASKTIQDLEKPDSRNMIRTEMISTFNTALGEPAVKEMYITEFAIQ